MALIQIFIAVILTSAFVSAAIFMGRALYHFYYMNIEVKSKQHDLARNIFPVYAFTKKPYTELGKHHLKEFSKNSLIFLAHVAVILIVYLVLDVI